jgi:signal transduction histidine kinase/CheY-like chemotaxis protein
VSGLRSAGEWLPGFAGFSSFAATAMRRVQPSHSLQLRLNAAPVGSAFAFLRDGGRLVRALLRRARARAGVPLARWLPGGFSLHGLETAWFASGAATQLADAALGGETTPELATRIARIARTLTAADAAAVHGRAGSGLKLLGSDGECRAHDLAERALAGGAVARDADTVAIPLRMGGALVGVLTVRSSGRVAGKLDLRPLQPLLSRAGAVLAAAEREARKDRFLSLAAHELKTPLTSIKGFSYSLSRRLERGEPTDPRHVQVLERQAERLHSLLEEMLEVSRLETGRFVLHQEPCELRELVDSCHRSLRRLGQDASLEAHEGDGLPLLADRERIERALSSMVSRARAHGPEVRIRARLSKGLAEVRVSWNTVVLSAQEQADAFSPRWEAPAAQRQGLGMALFIARETAELHGGALRCEGDALVLELPLRESGREQRGGDEGRVLVVDDDEPLARMMAGFLAESGFVADCATSGAQALEKIAAAPPDVLVLDLRMPEMNGRALLEAVRATGARPRVVLLSADREVATAARELATEAFVEKPFAPEGLLAAVRRALGPRPK